MKLPASFFVSATIHERRVKLGDGEEHVLHFRELPWAEWHKAADLEASEDEDRRAAAACQLIAASLCDAEGKPAITVADALRLRADVVAAMVAAIRDVNGRSKPAGKP